MKPYRGKRSLDLFISGLAVVIFTPLAIAVAAASHLDDGGPLFFEQVRVGRGRRPIAVLKFRSMRDHKITRVGHWLRRTAIDELPQFVQVIRGEMSVVGPRPLTAADVDRLGWNGPEHDWRFEGKPGITGLSQLLAGRGVRASERLDRLYLRRQNLLLDLRLIGLSFAVNVLGKRRIRTWMSAHNPSS